MIDKIKNIYLDQFHENRKIIFFFDYFITKNDQINFLISMFCYLEAGSLFISLAEKDKIIYNSFLACNSLTHALQSYLLFKVLGGGWERLK